MQEVLKFIDDFKNHSNIPYEIERLFRSGYCYYFAHILKDAFNRGEVCWCAPLGHIVWTDTDGVSYDIEGINNSECLEYIPIKYMGDTINDFKRTDKSFNASKSDIIQIIKNYYEDINKTFDENDLKYYFKGDE